MFDWLFGKNPDRDEYFDVYTCDDGDRLEYYATMTIDEIEKDDRIDPEESVLRRARCDQEENDTNQGRGWLW